MISRPNMLRLLAVSAATATCFAVSFVGAAHAQPSGGSLFVLSLGGSYQEAQSKEWFKPFAKQSGVNVKEGAGYNFAKLRVMIKTGNVDTDVIDLSADSAAALNDENLLEPIDWSKIPASCQSGIPANLKLTYAFPINEWAMVMAYNTKRYTPQTLPKTWADFWNASAFPGRRVSIGAARPPVEQAALAVNGDLAHLYPFDLDAAMKKMRSLGSNLMFVDGYAQVAQYLADGEADLAIIPNGRVPPLVAAGKPIGINWNQHIRYANFFVIPKGAPNKDNAMRFLAWVCQPQVLARLAEPTSYGPVNRDSYKYIAPEVAKMLPGNPDTASLGREVDAVWMSRERPEIAKKWASQAIQ